MSQRRELTTSGKRGRSLRVATRMGEAVLAATSVETARHSDDVELITGAMCEHLDVPESERESVLAAARLHDIGKMALPPSLLKKPGELNAEEWRLIRQHTIVGEQILCSVNELTEVAALVRHSHERWDGDGYPDGLQGEQIPLGSRIIFCADAFHAIRSDRAYRNGTSAERALAEIRRNSGTQFDPGVVDALTEVVHELRLAPERHARSSPRLAALLMVLGLGMAGTAVGRSDVLGEAQQRGPESAEAATTGPSECQSGDCSAALGPVVFSSLQPAGSIPEADRSRPKANAGSFGPGAAGARPGVGGGESKRGKTGSSSGSPGGRGGVSNGNGNANGNGNGNGDGNGNRTGGRGGSGKSKDKAGLGSSRGSGKSGKNGSGNANGQETAPGNSANAPGQLKVK